jgi:LysM repeat protein
MFKIHLLLHKKILIRELEVNQMNMIDCATILNSAACQKLVQNGITHVGRYLPTQTWKGLTVSEVSAIRSSGLNIIPIYESGANVASYFNYNQGASDAVRAVTLAKQIGQHEGTAIYFTVDYDVPVNDSPNILNYFQGLRDTLKSYKIGCYGKYSIINLIKSKGLADYFWQTYAWSSGQHASGLHLMQYKNDVAQYGLGFNIDMDQIENADCGSWGEPQPIVSNGILTMIQIVNNTDIRSDPNHQSGFIKNAVHGEFYNVTGTSLPDWYQVLIDDHGGKGWIDGNNGQNVVDTRKTNVAKTQTYKIQSGQTLTKIAGIFHTTVQNLLILNPNITNPNKIDAGQTIIVPN